MTMDMEKRIERIKIMEENLDTAAAAVKELSCAVERYLGAKAQFEALEEYCTSPLWLCDFEADEKGLLPADLKRGVLSEDAVHNLLCDNKELLEIIKNEFTDICQP